jgi:hypothetical protein
MSQEFARAARKAGGAVELVELARAGHFELIDPRTPEGRAVIEAVQRAVA